MFFITNLSEIFTLNIFFIRLIDWVRMFRIIAITGGSLTLKKVKKLQLQWLHIYFQCCTSWSELHQTFLGLISALFGWFVTQLHIRRCICMISFDLLFTLFCFHIIYCVGICCKYFCKEETSHLLRYPHRQRDCVHVEFYLLEFNKYLT